MTDTFDVAGDFAPAENFTSSEATSVHQDNQPEMEADAPNGFVELGLAPELVQAVKDLGYTQPTPVSYTHLTLPTKRIV